jgi:hypothetical protein
MCNVNVHWAHLTHDLTRCRNWSSIGEPCVGRGGRGGGMHVAWDLLKSPAEDPTNPQK